MGDNIGERQLEITYPCEWEYKLIGKCPKLLRAAVDQVACGMACKLTESNVSSGGKYCSVRLEVLVPDEATRDFLFEQFSRHDAITMVL